MEDKYVDLTDFDEIEAIVDMMILAARSVKNPDPVARLYTIMAGVVIRVGMVMEGILEQDHREKGGVT